MGFTPQRASFGRVKLGETQVKEIEITGTELDGVEFELLPLRDQSLQARLLEHDGKHFVEVTLTGDTPRRVKGRVTVKTTHPKARRIDLLVHGEITGHVEVFPPRVVLRNVDQDPTPAHVSLRSSEEGFKVLSVSDPQGRVQTTLSNDGENWKVDVEPVEVSAKAYHTSLVIETNDALQSRIEVPVMARVSVARRSTPTREVKRGGLKGGEPHKGGKHRKGGDRLKH